MKAYERQLGLANPVPYDEAVELHRKMQAGDQAARARLIESVLRLAYGVAKKFARKTIPLDDLIGEASVHAIRAVDDWNPERAKLSTAVTTYVTNGLKTYLIKFEHRGIYLPRKTHEAVMAGVDPSDCTPCRKNELIGAYAASQMGAFSSFEPKDGELRFDVEDKRDQSEPWFCLADLDQLLHHLTNKTERRVFKLWFGIGCEKAPYTAIAPKVGLTTAECQRIIKDVVERLRRTRECQFCGDMFHRNVGHKRYCSERCFKLGTRLINTKHHRRYRREKAAI